MTEQTNAASTTIKRSINEVSEIELNPGVKRNRKQISYEQSLTVPQVSNYGRVRNSHNVVTYGSNCPAGYKVAGVHRMTIGVHILVSLHFLGEPSENMEVDHIDRNRANNHVENLRFVSRKENAKNRTLPTAKSGQRIEAKKVSDDEDKWVEYESAKKAADATGAKQGLIWNVCGGFSFSTNGYNFRYALSMFTVLPGEEFRQIGTTDTEVSNFGRMRQNHRIREGWRTSQGYTSTIVDRKTYYVHRLVAAAFPDKLGVQPSNAHSIDHKDNDHSNNHVDNLEWVTSSEQSKRSRHYRRFSPRGGKKIEVKKRGEDTWQQFNSIRDASRHFGFRHSSISNVINGHGKSYLGYEFRAVPTLDLDGEIWRRIDIELILKHRREAYPQREIPH